MSDQQTPSQIHKGLAGVVADATAISKVNPETNSLLYRGYPVHELAATQSLEAVAYLLWNGDLPDADQLAALRATERAHRRLAEDVKAVIDLTPLDAHPMDEVRSAVSVLGARDLAGTAVLVGVPTPEMTIDLPLIDVFGRGGSTKSSWYGDCLPSRDFPMLIDLYLQGRLDLDRFVSETIALDQVEEAFHRMERGEVLRSVVVIGDRAVS